MINYIKLIGVVYRFLRLCSKELQYDLWFLGHKSSLLNQCRKACELSLNFGVTLYHFFVMLLLFLLCARNVA